MELYAGVIAPGLNDTSAPVSLFLHDMTEVVGSAYADNMPSKALCMRSGSKRITRYTLPSVSAGSVAYSAERILKKFCHWTICQGNLARVTSMS